MSINIQQVPNAPGGYSLTGKKVMVHDQTAPLATSTVMVNATSLATGGSVIGYAAPMWKESDGDMTAGLNTFSDVSLIGASDINFIIVNKIIEFIDEDYTFNDATGTITRTNIWFAGDKMVTPYKPGL
jgi:hypothetical protein